MKNITPFSYLIKSFPFICLMVTSLLVLSNGELIAQASDTCNCTTIDFETIPGDSVYEGLMIHEQYADILGMTFILE